jgi:hypothetical protein
MLQIRNRWTIMNRYPPLLMLIAACSSSAVVAQDAALTKGTIKELRESGTCMARSCLGTGLLRLSVTSQIQPSATPPPGYPRQYS